MTTTAASHRYIVKAGDCLRKIVKDQRNPVLWREIAIPLNLEFTLIADGKEALS